MSLPYRLTLREFPLHERPRERLAAHGPGVLTDAELLALLLSTGTVRETALDLARRLLQRGAVQEVGDSEPGVPAAGLRWLLQAPVEELAQQDGIGLAKAARVKAALELGRRLAAADHLSSRPVIGSPADAAALLMERMRYLEKEHVQVVFLNTKNRVLGFDTVSVGGLSESVAHPREIFRSAIRRNAAAIILSHNHPSGDPAPSPEDLELTRRVRSAGEIVGIELLDHIIIGDNRYVSLRERGRM